MLQQMLETGTPPGKKDIRVETALTGFVACTVMRTRHGQQDTEAAVALAIPAAARFAEVCACVREPLSALSPPLHRNVAISLSLFFVISGTRASGVG